MKKDGRIIRLLTDTNHGLLSFSLLMLRCLVGVILFVIGAGKVFGWFGGQGMELTIQNFVKMGFAAPLVYLSSFTELIGGFLLIVGLLTRPAAFAVTINMLVATITIWPTGFFTGRASFPFSLMIIAIVILLAGPMAYSLDFLLLMRSDRNPS
jgi:putative oxidoreductase